MNKKIGIITSYYGFRGNLVNKVNKLVEFFSSINMQPYIQLNSNPQKQSFSDLAKELNKLKYEYDIQYSIHQSMFIPNDAFYLNLGSSNHKIWKQTVDALKKTIDFAEVIGVKNVSFHAGYANNKVEQKVEMGVVDTYEPISFSESYANFRRGLSELLYYRSGGVTLSIENNCYRPSIRNIFSKSEDFRYLFDDAKILFDIGHAYYSKNKLNDNRYIDRIIEERRISEIHISDNNGMEDQHKLIGFGTIPFVEIFKKIVMLQKIPPVIIEANQKRWNYTDKQLAKSILELEEMLDSVDKWEYSSNRYIV